MAMGGHRREPFTIRLRPGSVRRQGRELVGNYSDQPAAVRTGEPPQLRWRQRFVAGAERAGSTRMRLVVGWHTMGSRASVGCDDDPVAGGGILSEFIHEALAFPARPEDRAFAAGTTRAAIDGDPAGVRERILALAEAYGASEVSILTSCYAFQDRVRSYAMIAAALGLPSQSATASSRLAATGTPGEASPPIQ